MHEERMPKWTAVFITPEDRPVKSTPLDHYKYSVFGGETTFYRLYVHEYEHPEGLVRYPVERWEEVGVKSSCVAAMKSVVDLMKSAVEFLNR